MYISEIGWNFMGDLNLAKKMITDSKNAGATHVKFQYWQEKFLKEGAWDKDGRREIYMSAQLNGEKIEIIKSYCKEIGIPCFFSVFNIEDAKFIKSKEFEVIKIPSHEIANYKLIEYCFLNFNTIYLSAGACTEDELEQVSELEKKTKPKNLVVMHCVSCYPCKIENANLPRLKYLNKLFPNRKLGLSDHTQSLIIPAIAAPLGAEVIEKHFTSDHNLPGRDNKFALLPDEFKEMVNNHKIAMSALTDKGIDFQECESDTVKNYRGRWNKI